MPKTGFDLKIAWYGLRGLGKLPIYCPKVKIYTSEESSFPSVQVEIRKLLGTA